MRQCAALAFPDQSDRLCIRQVGGWYPKSSPGVGGRRLHVRADPSFRYLGCGSYLSRGVVWAAVRMSPGKTIQRPRVANRFQDSRRLLRGFPHQAHTGSKTCQWGRRPFRKGSPEGWDPAGQGQHNGPRAILAPRREHREGLVTVRGVTWVEALCGPTGLAWFRPAR